MSINDGIPFNPIGRTVYPEEILFQMINRLDSMMETMGHSILKMQRMIERNSIEITRIKKEIEDLIEDSEEFGGSSVSDLY
jgi:uncharacterized protein YkuJ